MTVDKAAIERDLRASWDTLKSLVDALSPQEITQPGVIDSWSVKDLLGHMAFWAEKAAFDLKLLAAGRAQEIDTPGTLETLNAWNAREAEARRHKSVEELRAEWLHSYQDALAALHHTDAPLLETDVKGWPQITRFLGTTTEHYKEHADHIRAWQRQLETTEA